MTFGEQLFLGLVLLAFLIFGATLATICAATNRHMRRHKSATKSWQMDRSPIDKVA